MEKKEKTKRGQGKHLPRGVVKAEIIQYILSIDGAVPGPDIRRHLREKPEIGIREKKNIKDHLERLGPEYHCIEKIPFEKEGYENKWDIKKIKNLQSIKNHFSEIQLNRYQKTLVIILRESGLSLALFKGFYYYILLLISTSFFDKCIELGIKKLYYRLMKNYQKNKGFLRHQYINAILNRCYDTYIERNPKSEISNEKFRKIMEQISLTEFDANRYILPELLEVHLPGLSKEVLMKNIEENPNPMPKEIPVEIGSKINDTDLEAYIYEVLWWMRQELWDFDMSVYEILFDLFTKLDDINAKSSEETEFIGKAREILSKYSRYQSDIEKIKLESEYLKLASEIVVNYKQPLIFGKTYDNPDDAYQALEKFYHGERRSSSLSFK